MHAKKIAKIFDITFFARLPEKSQTTIEHGCACRYCKAHPDKKPMWDALGINPYKQETWTVHYPEFLPKVITVEQEGKNVTD